MLRVRNSTVQRWRDAMPERQATPERQAPPGSAPRLLAVVDYAAQPYNLGDLLIYLTGTLVAAEEAGAGAVDFCLISDPDRPPCDPVMARMVTRENHRAHAFASLPVLRLHPRLGAIHVLDRAADLDLLRRAHGGSHALWPSREQLAAKTYLFYEVFKAVHRFHAAHRRIPQLAFGEDLRRWASSFFDRHARGTVPVSVNLRNNPTFHAHRNSILPAWKAFFDACRGQYPVTFVVTCAASEVDERLRACPNVVFAKDHHTDVLQDLAIIGHAAFHLGAASGPAAMPIFGARPYHIFHCDMAPHLALYGGSLQQEASGELRYAWAREHQRFGVVPETADGILAQFERMWHSRGWREQHEPGGPGREPLAASPP